MTLRRNRLRWKLTGYYRKYSGQAGYGDLADHGEYQAGTSCGIIAILKVQGTGEF